jgi:hypothetical protein
VVPVRAAALVVGGVLGFRRRDLLARGAVRRERATGG